MVEYNGSIEVIGGLKPINGRNFPLVNAPDVLMPDGKRLSEIDFENLGGGDTFPVGFVVNPADFTATCDKTFTEIYTAIGEGKFVYGIFSYMEAPVMIPFICVAADSQPLALFEGTYEVMYIKARILVLADGNVMTQVSKIDSGGGTAPSVPPTGVDMSRFESDGIIEETYADGAVKTTTIEYDSTGNPVKITDGDGNVTELVW